MAAAKAVRRGVVVFRRLKLDLVVPMSLATTLKRFADYVVLQDSSRHADRTKGAMPFLRTRYTQRVDPTRDLLRDHSIPLAATADAPLHSTAP